MVDAAIDLMPTDSYPVPAKKGRSRRALKQTNPSPNEANIAAVVISQPSPTYPLVAPPEDSAGKENHDSLSQPRSAKKTKAANKGKGKKQSTDCDFEKEMQEMQEKLQQLRLEKEQTEELLKSREETLKEKEEELEMRGKEQEMLQMQLKKLQKMKEFKPTMTLSVVHSLKDNELEKKDKKKRGCPQTKRPSPAYVLWCKDQWHEIKKENPDAEFKAISTILGTKWKTVSDEEKKPYEEKYQVEKEAYLKVVGNEKRENEAMKLLEEEQKQKTAIELLEQYLQFKQDSKKENKKTKKERDPLKPKHPISAYLLFTNERRAALVAENKNVLEVAKITGEEWRNMTEKQKRPYEKAAKLNKEKYMEEMEAYKQKKEEEAVDLCKEEEELMKIQKQEALQLLKKKEKTDNLIKKTKENRQKKKMQKEEKNVDPNRPKKPASSFLMFSKEARKNLREERPGTNNSTLTALISVRWKELSEQDKQIWNKKAAEAMEAHKKELEEYNKFAAAHHSEASLN